MKTIEDYKTTIDGFIQNPDEALPNMEGFYKELEEDLVIRDTLLGENTSLKEEVTKLKDINLKLYMSQSQKPNVDEHTDDVDVEQKEVDSFFNELNGIKEE